MPDEEKPPIAGAGPRLATECPPEADSLGHGVAESDRKVGAAGEEPTEPENQPTVERPIGDDWMTLCKAALWIATEGGTVPATSGDKERWEAAFKKLFGALSFGKLRCVGERDGKREDIPTEYWVNCLIDYVGAAWVDDNFGDDLYLQNKLHLRTYAVLDADDWPNGVGDALLDRQDGWTKLMVPEEAVLDRWPFEAGHVRA